MDHRVESQLRHSIHSHREARVAALQDRARHEQLEFALSEDIAAVMSEVTLLSSSASSSNSPGASPHRSNRGGGGGSVAGQGGVVGEPEPKPEPETPFRLWCSSWNTAVNEEACEDLRSDPDACFASWVPKDCDIYIMGLQEGSAQDGGEYVFDRLGAYLARAAQCVRLRPPNGMPDRIWGRGDGALWTPKYTGIAIFCTRRALADVCVVASAGAPAGLSEGSKGAIGVLLRVRGTTMLVLSCHLAAHSVTRRRDQYAHICAEIGSKLGCPKIGDLHSQFHHVVWLGDFNAHLKSPAKGGWLEPHEVVRRIGLGDLESLEPLDELYEELDLPTGQRPKSWCGFHEAPRWQPANRRLKFYPTYKKNPDRNVPDYHGGQETAWVRQTYDVDYHDRWYKGGGVKLRMPSWCDRVLYRSMPHLAHRLLPVDHSYRAVNDKLLRSDHSPVHCSFELYSEPVRATAPPPPRWLHVHDMADTVAAAALKPTVSRVRITIGNALVLPAAIGGIAAARGLKWGAVASPPRTLYAAFVPFERGNIEDYISVRASASSHVAQRENQGSLGDSQHQPCRFEPVVAQKLESSGNDGSTVAAVVSATHGWEYDLGGSIALDPNFSFGLAIRVTLTASTIASIHMSASGAGGMGSTDDEMERLGCCLVLPLAKLIGLSQAPSTAARVNETSNERIHNPSAGTRRVDESGNSLTTMGGGGMWMQSELYAMPPVTTAGREVGAALKLWVRMEALAP